MANVSRLLHSTPDKVDLLAKLELLPAEREKLKSAKEKIRDHLRNVFRALRSERPQANIPIPRFFTQGSDAYKTLNRPAHMPPQQMDLDDGMYLPMSFVKNAQRPSIAAAFFFQVVDMALAELAKKEGWKLDTSKATCVRVEISTGSHIDVPLYAIPDSDLALLEKATLARYGQVAMDSFDFIEASRKPDLWEVLPSERVLLAHREEDWKVSDPRKIHVWFLDAVDMYGEQLRRQCRYLKAWRDNLKLSGVSSLALMVCVWTVYEEIGRGGMPTRDDLTLAKIAARLHRLLRGEIYNPCDLNERLDECMSQAERQTAVQKASELADRMNSIVEHCYDAGVAIEFLQQDLGNRIALRPDLVGIEQPAKEVYKRASAFVAAPVVGRSHSG